MAISANDIQKLYVAYYSRPADPSGLAYWLDYASKMSGDDAANLLAISDSFGSNAEYTANFTGLNSDGIINKVYMNLFSHAPDVGGLAYWSLLLSNGTFTLAQIVRTISEAALTLDNLDGIAFTSKVAAANAFTAALDTPGEVLGYTGLAAGNLAKAFLFGVNSEASLNAAIDPAALQATVANVVAIPGQTFAVAADMASIDEGGTVVFSLDTTNVPAGTSVSYSITGTGGAASATVNGEFVVNAMGKASVSVTIPSNTDVGDSGTLVLKLLNASAATASVIVVDVSVDPALEAASAAAAAAAAVSLAAAQADVAAEAAARTEALATDAVALTAVTTVADAAAAAAVTAKATADANVAAAYAEYLAADALTVAAKQVAYNQTLLAQIAAETAVTNTAATAATAKTASDAATAADAAFAAALTTTATSTAKAVADAALFTAAAAANVSSATDDADAVVATAAAQAAADAHATVANDATFVTEYEVALAAATASLAAATAATADATTAADAATAAVATNAATPSQANLAAIATAKAAADVAATAAATSNDGAIAAVTAAVTAAAKTIDLSDDAAVAALLATANSLPADVTAAQTANTATGVAYDAAVLNQVAKVMELTPGIDLGAAFTGGAGDDTYTGIGNTNTLTALDNLDGGLGNDTLTVTSVGAITTAGSTVVNVETANFVSAAGVNADTSSWTGLTALNVTSAATADEVFTAAATTTVKVANSTAFAVDVVGAGGVITVANNVGALGKVNIGQTAVANAITSAVITGGSDILVQDRSGAGAATGSTLTAVSLKGNTGAAILTGNAITSVTVANTNQSTSIVAAPGARNLDLTLNTITGGIYTDGFATTVKVTSTGAANTIANLDVASATAVTLGGDKALTLTTTDFDNATALTVNGAALTSINGYNTTTKLATVTVEGAGGLATDLSGQGPQLTLIDASTSSGANTVAITDTTSYKGGSGVDTVVVTATPTLTVDGGTGTDDVLIVNAGGITFAKVTAFETLNAGLLATGAYSAAGFSHLTQGGVAGAITWNSVAAGTDLKITADTVFATVYTLATDTATDTLDLTLTSNDTIDADSLTATKVETVNITLVDSDIATVNVNLLTLVDTTLATLKISGNAGLVLTATDATVKLVDASGMNNATGVAGEGFTWAAGAVVDNLVVKGSAAGGDNIDVHLAATAGKTTTVTLYSGENTVTGSGLVDTITGGSGKDTILAGAGNDVIVGGGGADIITGGLGADKITVTGSTWTIVQAMSDSGLNTANVLQTSELTSTFDVVYGATAGGQIDLGNIGIATGGLELAAINLAAGLTETASFATGTYDSAAGTFTYAANGADTALTYDADNVGDSFETIILVGYVAGAGTAALAGVLTLA